MTARTGFLKSGHLPTLVGALLYFDVSFMVWVLLGPLSPFLRDRFALSPAQQGRAVAIPLLGGSCSGHSRRVADRIGGRRREPKTRRDGRNGLIGWGVLGFLFLVVGWVLFFCLGGSIGGS
jgi:hypothetical protein